MIFLNFYLHVPRASERRYLKKFVIRSSDKKSTEKGNIHQRRWMSFETWNLRWKSPVIPALIKGCKSMDLKNVTKDKGCEWPVLILYLPRFIMENKSWHLHVKSSGNSRGKLYFLKESSGVDFEIAVLIFYQINCISIFQIFL